MTRGQASRRRPGRTRRRGRPATATERFIALRAAVIADDRLGAAQRRKTLSELTDAWLSRSFLRAPTGMRHGFAVVALGGYGRQELLPESDLDVALLHRNRGIAVSLAERVFEPLWAAGLSPDHSVWTIHEALEVAENDLRIALGLMDARHVAGDSALTEAFRTEVRTEWRRQAQLRVPELAAMCRARAARFGELGHLLEPDLVRAHGGLHDSLALRALGELSVAPPRSNTGSGRNSAHNPYSINHASRFTDHPHTAQVEHARQWLLTVRDAVHRLSGRREDRLRYDLHADVAARLMFPGPDALLRRVAEAGRTVAHASNVTWREVERTLGARKRAGRHTITRRTLADGVEEYDGEVVLARDARPERDAVLPLRAGAVAAQAGLTLNAQTVHRLATECPPLPTPWPRAARDALVGLLGAGAGVVPVWDSMEASGLVDRWIPEWRHIRYRLMRTPVHRHTVDRHLVETALVAAGLAHRVTRPDLLILAALFHDLGKGRAGDHSVNGETIAHGLGQRLGLTAGDTATLGRLVRHHLLLPEMATRRDPDDPATLATVLDAVRTRDFLDLLAALTEADATAAGPLAWSPLRARLVGELVERARAVLSGAPLGKPAGLEPWQRELAERGGRLELRVDQPGPDGSCRVTIGASPEAFAPIAGALEANGLAVRTAMTEPVGDVAVLVWQVSARWGAVADEVTLRAAVDRAVSGGVNPAAAPATRTPQRRIAHAIPRVEILPRASLDATVLEVRAHDEPGLLYRLATAVTGGGVRIRSAVRETLGSEAIDVFYLVGEGARPLPRKRAAQVAAAARAALPP